MLESRHCGYGVKNWAETRRAWKAYGVEVFEEEAEIRMTRVTGCVRLDPNGSGEVVWGERIDPARTVISNVPLPESGRGFRDVILNDGAANGKRADADDNEIPVFDELGVWKASPFSTFRALANFGWSIRERPCYSLREPTLELRTGARFDVFAQNAAWGILVLTYARRKRPHGWEPEIGVRGEECGGTDPCVA